MVTATVGRGWRQEQETGSGHQGERQCVTGNGEADSGELIQFF